MSIIEIKNKKLFDKMLDSLHARYNQEKKMIYEDNVFHDYHSRWQGRAHKTVESLSYAVALLQAGNYEKRANDIIENMLTLQDLDENSPTYGLWSWYLEEPLDKMAPPDYNWADFCSTRLMYAVLLGYDKKKVEQSVLASCRCIMKRDVQPDYMNIAVLGAYATLHAGEMFENAEIFDYGKARLKKFYEAGTYSEYNSTTYMLILIRALTDIREHIKDSDCKETADALLLQAWEIVASHFHPETMQWAGPMTRTYSTVLSPYILGSVMSAAFGAEIDGDIIMASEDFVTSLKCPEQLCHYFERTAQPRFISKNYIGDSVANTYITPEYCIGSFAKSDMWNQRRTLLAFWGTPEDVKYFSLRTLHDGYDYCAATIETKQEKGRADSRITFETEGGDTHINLDRIVDGKIKARDFRIVFDFHNTPPKFLTIHKAVFDGKNVEPIVTERGIELVLYSGDEKEIDFKTIGESVVSFTFDISI